MRMTAETLVSSLSIVAEGAGPCVKEPLISSGLSAWRDEVERIKAKSARLSRLWRSFSTQSRGVSACTRRFMNRSGFLDRRTKHVRSQEYSTLDIQVGLETDSPLLIVVVRSTMAVVTTVIVNIFHTLSHLSPGHCRCHSLMFLGVALLAPGCWVNAATDEMRDNDLGKAASLEEMRQRVTAASAISPPWDGPRLGPKAKTGRTIAIINEDLRNGGILGVAQGVREAAKVLGWKVKMFDAGGTQEGRETAHGGLGRVGSNRCP